MYSLTLQNAAGDSIITSGNILGRLNFAVPSESDGAAATYVVSQIYSISEGSFTSASNPAGLLFATSSADSAPATGRIKISSDGHFIPLASGTYDLGSPSLPFRNLYINSGDITAQSGYFDVISFNVDNESILTKGQISWDDTEGTMDIGLTDNTTIHIGEHRYFRIRNETGGTLYKGQVVYATGVHSNGLITPDLYVADGTIREVRFMGVILENVNDNNNGYVVDFGHLHDMDLDGSASNYAVGDETWAAGDILYVHPTGAGKLTKVEPKHSISVAIVLDPGNGNGNGRMFVRPTSYGHLNDNHDVNTSGLLDNQFLVYDSGTDYWQPSSGLYYVDGDLGIGTASPSEKLDVSGGIGHVGWKTFRYIDTAGPNGSSNGFAIKLNDAHGTTLNTEYHYRIRLTTDATATTTGATYLVWYKQATSSWEYRVVSWAGSTSNHCLLAISGSNAIAYTNHPSTSYDINCVIESYHTSNQYSLLHSMGSDYQWQRYVDTLYYNDGNVGVGTSASVTSRFQVEGGDVTFNDNGGTYNFRVAGDADQNLLFVQGADGHDNVAIGTNTPLDTAKFQIQNQGSTAKIYSQIIGGNNKGFGLLNNQSVIETLNSVNGFYSYMFSSTNGAVTDMYHFRVDPPSGVGTITSQRGFYAGAGLQYAAYNYGFVGNVPQATNNYNLYMGSSAKNYFNGDVGIGTASPDGKLHIKSEIVDQYHLVLEDDSTSNIFQIGVGDTAGVISVDPTNTNASSNLQFHVDGSSKALFGTSTNFFYQPVSISASNNSVSVGNTSTVFNEDGNDIDFRVEGLTDDNLLFTDASTDRVGIGTPSPSYKLDIRYPAGGGMALIKDSDSNDGLLFGDMAYSTSDAYQGIKHVGMTGSSDYMLLSEGTNTLMSAKGTAGKVYIRGGGNYGSNQILVYGSSGYTENAAIELDAVAGKEIVVNQQQRNVDFRVESNTDEYLLFTDASTDRVGINTSDPQEKLSVTSLQADIVGFHGNATGPVASGDLQSLVIRNSNDSLITEHYENTDNTSTKVLKNLIRYGADFVSIDDAYDTGLGTTFYPKFKVNTDTGAITFNDQFTFPTTDGSSDQVLVTDGSGALTWQDQQGAASSSNYIYSLIFR
jgi:hypothetical protein